MDTSEDPLLPQVHGPLPRDRFHMVYMIFYLLGLGSLAPWNFFITASEYFKYKLRNTTQPDEDYLNPEYETELQKMFESYLVVANTIPNLAFNFITALIIQRIALKTRMVFSLVVIILMFVLTVSLVKINTDAWQSPFFCVTLVTAVLISYKEIVTQYNTFNPALSIQPGNALKVATKTGGSILGASLFGLASLFPSQYVQATMTGQAMGGIFAAVANLVTLAMGSNVINSGLAFFLFAAFMAVLTLMGYGCLYSLNYSKYHILEIGGALSVDVNSHSSDHVDFVNPDHGCSYYINIFKKVWKEGLSVCLVFLVTLSCFPAIAASIVSVDKSHTEWTEKYFSALVCFLLFNCGDWSGRSVAGSIQWPRYGQSCLLLLMSVLRVVFIPLLMFCNAQPRYTHVYFDSDYYPVVFILLLGLTNGYFGTLAMMYGPQRVTPDKAESTGAMMSTFLTLGLVSGSLIAIPLMKTL